MNFNKVILGATLALGLAAFGTEENVKAAEWEARTAADVKADFQTADASNKTYTIQWGDTLAVIADAADVNLNTLAEINNIKNADLIFPGNKLSFKSDASGQVEEVTIEDTVTETIDTYAIEETFVEPVAAEAEQAPAAQVDATYATPVVETASASATNSVSSDIPYYVYQVVEAEAGPGSNDISNVASVIYNRAQNGAWGGTDALSVVQASGQFEVHATGAASATTPSQATIDIVNSVFSGNTTTSAESFRATGDGVTNYFF